MDPFQEPTELPDLIRRAKQGDKQALETLCRRFLPYVRKLTAGLDAESRQDGQSDLCLELLEAIRRFDPK